MAKLLPVVGIDDAGFDLKSWRSVPIFGVFMRGTSYVENVAQASIKIDDKDPTSEIIKLLQGAPQLSNLRCIFHQGSTIAGFCVVDGYRIVEELSIPVIHFLRSLPDLNKTKNALLKHIPDGKKRYELMLSFPKPKKYRENYIQNFGCTEADAKELTDLCIHTGNIPEPIRIAHIIGKSYYKFEKQRLITSCS